MIQRILIAEDADTLRDVLATVLETEGYSVDSFPDAESALKQATQVEYDLILSDFKLPKMNGIEFLEQLRKERPNTPFLLMTAYGSIDIAVTAMKQGANDFICKPFEPRELCTMIGQVLTHHRVIDRSLGKEQRKVRSFLTKDPATLRTLEQARKVARVDTSVMILGESGTGKELIARYVHEHSPRSEHAFVAINCAALPGELLESELFGHEPGAFTGATQTRLGLFEVAKDGTLFLDEIGDMPAPLQVKLLRALQEGEIRRIGGNKSIYANPRIIAATNCDIEASIAEGKLREDLYYRLAVVSLEILPLRRRPNDVEMLSQYFLEYFSNINDKHGLELEGPARELLQQYPWPGNTRELENTIERAVILGSDSISSHDLGLNTQYIPDLGLIQESSLSLPEVANRAARTAEIALITQTLERTKGNKSKAAQMLGVSYKTLLNKVKEYSISPST